MNHVFPSQHVHRTMDRLVSRTLFKHQFKYHQATLSHNYLAILFKHVHYRTASTILMEIKPGSTTLTSK